MILFDSEYVPSAEVIDMKYTPGENDSMFNNIPFPTIAVRDNALTTWPVAFLTVTSNVVSIDPSIPGIEMFAELSRVIETILFVGLGKTLKMLQSVRHFACEYRFPTASSCSEIPGTQELKGWMIDIVCPLHQYVSFRKTVITTPGG